MSNQQQVMQVETVPPRFLHLDKHGIETGFRLPWFGFVFQAGWSWREDQPHCLLGFDMPFGTLKYFNGPRLLQAGAILGFLRLRAGLDFLVFVGKRDQTIQAAIDAARKKFEEVIAQRMNQAITLGDPDVSPPPKPFVEVTVDNGVEVK